MLTGALLPYAQYVIYFTAGFMIIPTGRDVVAPGYPLLPGDAELLVAMNRDPVATPCSAFMWRVFGLNFVFMSILKFMTLAGAMMNFAVVFAVFGMIAIGLLSYYKPKFEEQKADITPFLALFTLETAAWLAIVLS